MPDEVITDPVQHPAVALAPPLFFLSAHVLQRDDFSLRLHSSGRIAARCSSR
jgi:hypothetical protein